LAVSSGGSSRQINLICGGEKIELEVPGGSSTYQRLESDPLPAGTYSIEREGNGNVRLGVVVLKFITNSDTTDTEDITEMPAERKTQKIVRDGQVLIIRDGRIYTIIGTRVR